MFDEWYIYHVMLCECCVLRKKIAPRCSGKFWKIFTIYKTGTKMRKKIDFINLFGLLGDGNNFLS